MPSGAGGASGPVAQGGASGDSGTGGRSSAGNQAGAGGSPPRGGNAPSDEGPAPNEGSGGAAAGEELDDDEAVSGGCRYGRGGTGSGDAGQALGLTALALLFVRRAQRRASRRSV